jgi:hypothetical protein
MVTTRKNKQKPKYATKSNKNQYKRAKKIDDVESSG